MLCHSFAIRSGLVSVVSDPCQSILYHRKDDQESAEASMDNCLETKIFKAFRTAA
jgi:hypothetical protein